jgi:hypothetical protein
MKPAAEPRGCLATIAVFVFMFGILAVGVGVLSQVSTLPPQPFEVSHGVVITPPEGWDFAGRSEDGETVLISQGSGSLAITVKEGVDPASGLDQLRTEWAASGTVTSSETTQLTDVREGQVAHRFAYSGTFPDLASPIEGEVTAFAGTGYSVLFDGWAGFGEYHSVRDEITTIIRAATIP